MKLTISTLACPDWNLAQIIEACTAHGIAGIDFRGLGDEIDITRTVAFTAQLDQTLAQLARHGLALPCFNTSVTLVSPGPQRWQDMLDEAHRYASLASRTGTLYLRIFGGVVPKGMGQDEALAMAQRHLRQVIKICRSHQCMPLIETHDAYATSGAMRQLLHDLSPEEVGVLWDIEHSHRAGEAHAATAQALGRFVRHVHFKDSMSDAQGKSTPRLLGQGDLPLAEVRAALRSIPYDGWICLETEKRWHREMAPDPEQSIPHFASYMKNGMA